MEIPKVTTRGTRSKQFDKGTAGRVIRLYESGLTVREVVEKTNLSSFEVHSILGSHGVELRRRGPRSKLFGKSTSDRVIRLYESGLTVLQVVEKTNLSRYEVGCILNRHGVQSHKRGRSHVELDRRQIGRAVKLYGSGMPLTHVMRETGLSRYYLERDFAKLGIPAHDSKHKFQQIPQKTKNKAVRLYASGLTMLQVAQQLNLTNFLVRKVLMERNHPIRPRGGGGRFGDALARPATDPANQPKRKK